MLTRVLHISDLHLGSRDATEIVGPLARLIDQASPELVVASGDLTHRGRPDQHERAARFLKALGPPVLAIPGNHDIPYTFPARFTRSFAEFERHWLTTEPVHRSPGLHVVGVNSVRPWRHQSGGVRESQLRRVADLLAEAAPGALRVVVLHHHLLGPPWRSRKKPVAHRNEVLASLVDAGAELILAGHIHQSTVAERREFEVSAGAERGVTISIASGLGQPRPSRRGEARGLHVYEVTERAVGVQTFVWREDEWALTASRTFPRGTDPLVEVPRLEAISSQSS